MVENDFLDLLLKETLKPKGQRTIVLGTFADGYPNLRNVIIRKFDKQNNMLTIFTHALSDKVEEIKVNKNVTLCWYTPKKRVQIQIRGKAELNQNKQELAHAFKNINPDSRKDYLGLKPGLDFQTNNQEEHFTIINIHIEQYTFLQLDREEHKKYSYKRTDNSFELQRLIP